MDYLKYILLALVLYYLYCKCLAPREHLRMQGSHDLRGDIPIPRGPVGPWNVGTSNPTVNRSMVMEDSY